MNASASPHPTDQTLHSFALGKLDDMLVEEVHKHLEDCPDCRRRAAEVTSDSFLGRLRDAQSRPEAPSPMVSTEGLSMLAAGPSAQAPPPASTMPPGLADHPDYQIVRELGRGGMGVVYLAQNTLMGRPEVLKVVGSHLITRPVVLDRFLREIRSAAKLHHTNIVTAYSALRLGESLVLAMEYVEGLDLAKIVKAKGPLPVANACSYVHQAALGLQHAHEHGMVHRDIKPSNLMLARAGKKAIVKVLDFGLAKVTSEGRAEGSLTREGQMLGTPDFIAPEQIRDAQSADIRADIYSLGCTLFYLLAGRPPFGGENLWDIYQAHFSMDAGPLNLVRPEVPVELAALVAKMMAKDPARRFQTPGEVAQSLTPFFKKANAAVNSSEVEVSLGSQSSAGQPGGKAVSAAPQPATETGWPVVGTNRTAESTIPKAPRESPIESPETEGSVDAAPAGGPVRRPPSAYRRKIIAASIFGLILLAGIIITIKYKNGEMTTIKYKKGEVTVTVADGKPEKIEHDSSKGVEGVRGMGGMNGTDGGMGMGGMMGRMMDGMGMMNDDPSPKTKVVRVKLDKAITMKFPDETPLQHVLKYIKQATKGPKDSGIPIYVDPNGLGEAQKTLTSLVTIDEESVPVKDCLESVLKQLGLSHCVRDGLLFISTQGNVTSENSAPLRVDTDDTPQSREIAAEFDEPIAMRFPDDTPLKNVLKYLKTAMRGRKGMGIQVYVDPKGLAKVGKTLASPVTMDVEGAPLRPTLRLLLKQLGLVFSLKKGMLYITAENQGGMMGGMGMMGQMMQMRGMGGGMGTIAEDISPRTKAASAKLDKPIAMKFPDGTPLKDVLEYIKQATKGPNDPGIPIYVDPNGFREAEETLTSTVTIDLENIPLKDSLELILDQLDLAYCIRDGLMFISSPSSVVSEKSQPLPATTDSSAESRAIAAKLDEPTTMRFPNPTPLKDVLRYITNVLKAKKDTGVEVFVDQTGLQKAEKTIASTVTIDVEGIPLRTTLRLLLKQIGLAFSLQKGVLHITAGNQGGMMGGTMGQMMQMRGMMGGGMMGTAESSESKGSMSPGGMRSGMEGNDEGPAKRKRTTPKGRKAGPRSKD
jgi:serine/threonine protein kinase